MNDNELRNLLTGRIIEAYGFDAGLRVANVLLPSVLTDFAMVMNKAKEGETAKEDYQTDDRKVIIHLEGIRKGAPGNKQNYQITEVLFNGNKVEIGQ
ncbi:hypothetical protein SAMN06296386_102333 [Lachnospiraceae bacterium]|nr:hypothetical protein SAMN06296386_102333 [Lachnospiraceae bacterium]